MEKINNRIIFTRLTIFLLSFFLLYSFSSCRKLTNGVETGVYVGTFTMVYPDTTVSGTTKLELKRKDYKCEGNLNRIPAGGSGSYKIKKGRIIFTDINQWTADFAWDLILNGEYEFESNGKKLILKRDYQTYNLERE